MAIDVSKSRPRTAGSGKYWAIAAVIGVAFFASYAYANAAKGTSTTPAWANGSATQAQYATAGTSSGGTGAGGAGGCCGGATASGGAPGASASGGCCGTGGTQTDVSGSTTVSGGVQKVTIDLTTGSYSPNVIAAKAGVPIELDFKGPASSCNGYVQSQDLGFSQDVSNGGTIKVGPLKPGTYTWACSMNMYTAKIVVK